MKGLFLDVISPGVGPDFNPGAYFMKEFGWSIPVALVIIAVVVAVTIIKRRRKK